MRTAFVRRTVLSASAVALALLATACGGSSDTADGKSDASAVKGKAAAELGAELVNGADLPDHVVKPPLPEEVEAAPSATSDRPECVPLVKAMAMAEVGTPVGTTRVKTFDKPKEPAAGASAVERLKAKMSVLRATTTAVTLTSYNGKGAEEAFASFEGAGTACAGGYSATHAGETVQVLKVAAGVPVQGGDESLAYAIELNYGGQVLNTQVVVVRKANALAVFSALSTSGIAEQPKAVVAAQVKKLG
ncbi:hypothetical protein ACFYYB_16950 [Streptomyces sp. NPDC002886]|uniref:hypothetical protein n=1 Tax=Streptomyces sp. NPDC002886 TaxID=3364667 RepID=UPI003681121E